MTQNQQTLLHYENHLANYYGWMLGDIESRMAEQETFFRAHKILPTATGIAIDLGAGNGLQSIPLARIGFNVYAIDFSSKLLSELDAMKGDLPIETIEGDVVQSDLYAGLKPELIVCMGDTLTHLPDSEAVQKLIQNAAHQLAPKAKLILSFRDFSTALEGPQRFIPVRQSDDRIFTCFLEYEHDYVKVFDIVHEKAGAAWQQKISWYRKLRLSKDEVRLYGAQAGFSFIFEDTVKGMVQLIAEKV